MPQTNSTNKTDHFYRLLSTYFAHEPTVKQKELFHALSAFLFEDSERTVFLLRGYAGTGKTSVIGALVKALPDMMKRSVLLAPTGRAAKVMGNYSGKPASTIHRKMYFKTSKGGMNYFKLMENKHKNTLFIVDEASMISVKGGIKNPYEEERNLLDDLMKYVYSGDGCKLILVGDTAQLPPVMEEESWALDANFIKRRFQLPVKEIELTQVMRQMQESGILFNSFQIRNQQHVAPKLSEDDLMEFPVISTERFKDVIKVNGYDLQDELESNIGTYGVENCMIITRSNKRANQFNQQVRSRVLWHEDEVTAGDLMMVVKNNYTWLDATSKAGFIANGDIIEILKIVKIEEIYGKRFANVVCRLLDYPEEPELETKIMLDTIMVEAPNLPRKDMKELFTEIEQDFMEFSNRKQRIKKVLDSPYFNALQVKFSYSVTCHKSQGGQWPVVFIDQGYLTDEMMNKEYLRWLYTAVTRAQTKLYLLNFNKNFFPNEKEEEF